MKKLLVLVFAIALCLGVLCLGASAADIQPKEPNQDSSGVYQIGTAAELYWFAGLVNSGDYDANAVLTDNITINTGVLDDDGKLNSTPANTWTPIGSYASAHGLPKYTGTFDGQGHTISGLYYDGDDYWYVGLFGYVDDGGHVQNVNIADSYISNSYSGNSYTGGVCGYSSGTITNCGFDGSVTGTGTGTGTGNSTNVGGVCGYNKGTITNCCNTGSVTGTGTGKFYVGGVCGGSGYSSTITNCYNTGNLTVNVTGTGNVGGVCGYSSGAYITYCYNTGNVTGTGNVGGVCGDNRLSTGITNCYWLSGTACDINATEKTAKQFASGEVAWLLNGEEQMDGPWRQNLSVTGADTYPTLDPTHGVVIPDGSDDSSYKNLTYDKNGFGVYGDKTFYQPATRNASGVYQISNAGQLYWFAQLVNGGEYGVHAELTNDITIQTITYDNDGKPLTSDLKQWTPICGEKIGDYDYTEYTGTFDGGNHTISGLYYNGSSEYVGLFGCVGKDGRVQNVGVIDSYVKSSATGACVGGVCGRNDGTISNCYNTGNVSGGESHDYSGGICGYNNQNGRIENCYNAGNVRGQDSFQGVCGRNIDGTITNCYWLSGTASDINATEKTADQFASGEVAWLLNKGQANGPWRQNLNGTSADAFPVLNSTHQKVVKLTVDSAVSYLNEGDNFTGETDRAYFKKDGTEIKLPYTVNEDTELTSAAIYTVTVVYDNGTADKTEQVVDGGTFKLPAAPGKSGYTFVGWSDGSNTYDPGDSVPITGNVTFTAVWREINIPDPNGITVTKPANGTVKVNPSNGSAGTLITVTATADEGYELAYITVDGERITGNTFRMPDKAVTVSAVFVPVTFPFTDVKTGDWFYDYVAYVYSNGLMDGTSATTFEPNANMTRAMVWAILARIDGETVTGAAWADTARAWAMAEGVSDGTDPNGLVTREQFATMLYRYAVAKGYDVSIGESTNILSYADFDKISEYAIPAMQWACGSGVITGVTESTLEPAGTATRAQCAAMLMRFVENVK